METPSSFGGRVRHLRQQAEDLACAELDRLAGLHRGHVWQIENGARENPERETVRGLARVLGCTVGWLLEAEGDAPSAADVAAAVTRARAAREVPDGVNGNSNDIATVEAVSHV